MDSLMRDYREKHRRCKFCVYYKYHSTSCLGIPWAFDYETCELKDKTLKTQLSAIFCNYYNVKG